MGLTVFDQTVGEEEVNTFQDLTFEEVLEDLSARFIVNLPPEEQELVRVYWQVEQAHWFYEDYVRPLNPHLPSYSQRAFAHLFISQSPYVSEYYDTAEMEKGYDEWMRYKSQVPVCGGILLNETADKCLLVRGYKSGAAWSFPRGKINLEESESDCAIREVFEETGYDFRALLRPNDFIQCRVAQQTVTLFLVPGVSEKTRFETQTRMEIGAIEWVPLSELPTWKKKKGAKADSGKEKKYYMVAPFVGHIKTWVKQYKKNNNIAAQTSTAPAASIPPVITAKPIQQTSYDDEPPPSALDVLFARFMTNKKDEEPTPVLQPASPADDSKQDDALARLLAGLNTGSAPTPAVAPPPQAAAQPINPLLALLNGKSPKPAAPTANNHHNALLALLSPSKSGTQLKPSSTGGLASHIADLSREQIQTPASALFADLARGPVPPNAFPASAIKPSSMPTSPRAASDDLAPSPDTTKAKQRALLEMMVSGLPTATPTSTSASASVSSPQRSGNTAAWVAGLEPPQQLPPVEMGLAQLPSYNARNGGFPPVPQPNQGLAPSGPSRQPQWNAPQPQSQPPPVLPHMQPPYLTPGQGYRPAPMQTNLIPPYPAQPLAQQPPFPLQPQAQQQQQQYRPPPAPTHNCSGSRDLPPHLNQPYDNRQGPPQQRWAPPVGPVPNVSQQPWNLFQPQQQQQPQRPPGPPFSQAPPMLAQPQARVNPSVSNLLAVLNGAPANNQRLQADVSAPNYPTGSPARPWM